MYKSIRFSGGFVLAGVLLTLAACDGPPPKPVQFNDRIAKNNERWYNAIQAFKKKATEPLSKGTNVSAKDAQGAYDELNTEFKAVKRASHHMPTPVSSPTSGEFRSKYQEYMDGQEQLLQNEVKQIVATAGNEGMPPAARANAIAGISAEVDRKEKSARDGLLGAQRAFASAHSLSVPNSGGGGGGPSMGPSGMGGR